MMISVVWLSLLRSLTVGHKIYLLLCDDNGNFFPLIYLCRFTIGICSIVSFYIKMIISESIFEITRDIDVSVNTSNSMSFKLKTNCLMHCSDVQLVKPGNDCMTTA